MRGAGGLIFLFPLWTGAVGHGGDPIPGRGCVHQSHLCVLCAVTVFLVCLSLPQMHLAAERAAALSTRYLTHYIETL